MTQCTYLGTCIDTKLIAQARTQTKLITKALVRSTKYQQNILEHVVLSSCSSTLQTCLPNTNIGTETFVTITTADSLFTNEERQKKLPGTEMTIVIERHIKNIVLILLHMSCEVVVGNIIFWPLHVVRYTYYEFYVSVPLPIHNNTTVKKFK